MAIEAEKTGTAVGFFDSECLCSTMLTSTDDNLAFSVSYMHSAFRLYDKKKLILTAYLSRNHWIAVAIVSKQQNVYYLDSLKRVKIDTTLSNKSLMSKLFLS
jgi:hypothetical protein